ncbi:bacterial extracellular solute-binding s, 5 Middle family protein [Burkholderia pseudomallei MSHR7527]|uniref:extracellular solute-binding protein n=2 Tax=Burkholderia pseudomallei TaxID=28450 RepID=UPI0005321064|nr:extracellular solute-binding protein [Burkholderia pseudomallei]KGS17249.1 bacterial extracellular solute-binding s, 5 Middle family protein [Burkholderia pseudomallei MSHR4378]KGS62769.1 bacterial extracellular solute-binding s, 5 Middle family protein [Burkholderia pseudomallei MSHR7527]KGS73396.1 bacterial extracellular solute-binding s, 5 Middle family protein [Burkholderia pseudomallei MSHR5596]KGU65350.1 bacterial extracellular solute-binding s, 5 Middle family protein [Burkholderia ps
MTIGSPRARRPRSPQRAAPSEQAARAAAPRRAARARAALARFARRAAAGVALAFVAAPAAHAVYAIAQYGEPKYPAGFAHFDYVNPDAPKGGTLVLANPNRLTTFDKFNPFTMRGNPAPGIDLLFESLTTGSADEPASAYGLLADDIAVAPDGLSVTFHLNPRARFSNGEPVTAADVKYSFDTLKSPKAAPQYPAYYADIARAVIVDAATVRFEFRRKNRELPLIAGGIPVFSRKWGVRADGSRIAFDQIAFEQPIGSGPYLIERYDSGRTITYRRNPAYWGAALPVRIGTNNFERIVYKLYGDGVARLEAFKAGEYDVLVEYIARNWARRDVGKRFDSGELVKREFRQHNGAGMQGFFMNLRRPLFQDVRVRHALDLAFDFEWLNRQLFYGAYTRLNSYFADTDLQATGTPSAGELALLAPLRAQLDPVVFGPMTVQPSTDLPASLRANLLKARALLAEAGWTYRDGALRNAKGEPFVFEILDDSGSAFEPVVAAYIRNLAKLGIVAKYRTADFALLQKRLDAFDYDMTTVRYPGVQVPGAEQVARFASRYADEPGSDNLTGLKSPAVDAILKALTQAETRDELLDATHALDRVLMHGYYAVPQWYSAVHRIAFKRTLAYPSVLPLYYSAEGWVASTWWARPEHGASAR